MANIFDVAKYILNSIGGEISTMKLQKLCYYSQAWSLAWGETLFEEDFEHWDNGPVCRELFDEHQGKFTITSDDISDDLLDSNHSLTDEQINTIDKVIETYGKYSGAQLSELTHKEEPWLNARKDVKDSQNCSRKISKKAIKEYYGSL